MDLASSAGSSAKECLLVLSEATKLIDSFRLIYLPGNSKLTVYTELSELKNTLEALKTALLKYLYCQLNRFMPSHIILRITHVLSEVHSTLFDVNHALSVDSWDAKHLKVYQLDFLIAFQTHQLQEVFAEQYSLPSALLCTASSKDFWDTYFPTQVRQQKPHHRFLQQIPFLSTLFGKLTRPFCARARVFACVSYTAIYSGLCHGPISGRESCSEAGQSLQKKK